MAPSQPGHANPAATKLCWLVTTAWMLGTSCWARMMTRATSGCSSAIIFIESAQLAERAAYRNFTALLAQSSQSDWKGCCNLGGEREDQHQPACKNMSKSERRAGWRKPLPWHNRAIQATNIADPSCPQTTIYRLAMVESDACVSLQLLFQHPVVIHCAIWRRTGVEIIQTCVQPLFRLQPAIATHNECWPNANKRGINGSPCLPTTASHKKLDGLLWNCLT